MQAQAYEGYFEDGQFYTAGQAIRIPERQRTFIMILNEPAQLSEKDNDKAFAAELTRLATGLTDEERERRIVWLNQLNEAIDLSLDEELPDFQRSPLMGEPFDLIDLGANV